MSSDWIIQVPIKEFLSDWIGLEQSVNGIAKRIVIIALNLDPHDKTNTYQSYCGERLEGKLRIA